MSFAGRDLAEEIAHRARPLGLELDRPAAESLAVHARLVLQANPRLHLTTITDPDTFLERHLDESLAGAALLPADVEGRLLDLGSGNGYPGLPVAVARPRLRATLAEASPRKAAFLREVIAESGIPAEVLERQVQRAGDLDPDPSLRVVTLRAVGNWERLLPRLVATLGPAGTILLWATDTVEQVRRRAAWKRLDLAHREPLAGLEHSSIWVFRAAR